MTFNGLALAKGIVVRDVVTGKLITQVPLPAFNFWHRHGGQRTRLRLGQHLGRRGLRDRGVDAGRDAAGGPALALRVLRIGTMEACAA